MQSPDETYCAVQVGGHYAKANSQRAVALVDVADADAVGAYRWHMSNGYVVRNARVGGKRWLVYLHREILGLGPDDPGVDHINGDKLDNRRQNLRACTQAQNLQNLHYCGAYRGAYWNAQRKCWVARVGLAGKQHYLGGYATREEAAAVAAAFRRQHMPFSRDAREVA